MANQEHLDILKQGVDIWNKWREEFLDPLIKADLHIGPDLSGVNLDFLDLNHANFLKANLTGASLYGAKLREANLQDAKLIKANLFGADMTQADLRWADLSEANLQHVKLANANLIQAFCRQADLRWADLTTANLFLTTFQQVDLRFADLRGANLYETNFRGSDLSSTDLRGAILIETRLQETTLNECIIYGISAWNLRLEGAKQSNLLITNSLDNEPTITVDDLEVAQFIYLLLKNPKIRKIIDTITSKVVLILGRFTSERKVVLDALREELRKRNYTPILFDFEKPVSRDLTETISTLAHMARFVIADLTDAKSIPQELGRIVPNLPSVPVQPLILQSQHEYGMFEHFTRFSWVLPVYRYTDQASLLQSLKEHIIDPAEQKVRELEKR